MFSPDTYSLLDFGDGRKLERFGEFILDRPAPGVVGTPKATPQLWRKADAYFDRDAGTWRESRPLPQHWELPYSGNNCRWAFELHRSPFGHLGVFVEQAENWDWLVTQVRKRESTRVLNLFGYTGGSTLALAAAGSGVTHLDAADNTVRRARRNAEISGLSEASIRWITDDATKFVKRELKRGSRYEGVVLDPPSFGRGAKSEVWQLKRDLPRLLEMVTELLTGESPFLLLTAHTSDLASKQMADWLDLAVHKNSRSLVSLKQKKMSLQSEAGKVLPSGIALRATLR